MKPAPLLIAVLVLAILGGLVYYTEENPPETDDERVAIVEVEKDDIQAVEIIRPDKDTLAVHRGEGGKWEFGEPLTIPADDSSINSLLTNLAPLNADRVVDEEVTDWGPYGLEAPGALQVTATVTEGETEKAHRVIFGRDTPTGSGVFARLDGDPRLFTVYSYLKSSFEKEPFDLRQKKLLAVDQDKISRVVVRMGPREIEFGKSGDSKWQILKPKPLRADNFTVDDLVRSVRNAEMVSVLEELKEGEKPSGTYSFSKPFATVEVTDEGGVHTLTVAKGKEESYHAKSSDLEGSVFEVSSTFAEGLDKPLEDFRNKKLFDFGFTDPARLQLRDGDTRLTVEKKDDKWVLTSHGDRELESEKVQTVIDNLRGLTSIAFTSDEDADQQNYGLGAPVLEAEVLASAEGSPDKVTMTSPAGERIYAAIDGQPTTYEIEKSSAEELQRNIQNLLKEEEPEETDEEEESSGS